MLFYYLKIEKQDSIFSSIQVVFIKKLVYNINNNRVGGSIVEKKIRIDLMYQFIFGILFVISTIILGFILIEYINPGRWYNNVISIAIAITTGLIFGIVFSRTIDKNFSKLKKMASDISNGKLTTKINMDKIVEDEVVDLLGSFELMRENIVFMIKNIKDVSDNINSSTKILLKNSSHIYNSSEVILEAVTSINEGALEQKKIIDEAGKSLKDLNDIIENNNVKAKNSDHILIESNKNTEYSIELIGNSITDLKQLLTDVTDSASKVLSFTNKLDKIDNIIDIITELAKKTDILAVNASIEAAKAGEVGKGFSVIADEIRLLADSTKKSVKEIDNISDVMIKESKDVSSSMNNIIKKISLKKEDLAEIINILQNITKNIFEFTQIVSLFKEDIYEVQENVINVSKVTEKAALIAEHNLKSANLVDEEVKFESKELESISASIKEFISLSETLQEIVKKFIIDEE